jgi:phosphoglucomutase
MGALEAAMPGLPGKTVAGLEITQADSFTYHDPVDGSVSRNQGLRIFFEGGGRVVLRLSGTGTEGATLRVYLEQYAPPGTAHDLPVDEALVKVRAATLELTGLQDRIGRSEPDVRT